MTRKRRGGRNAVTVLGSEDDVLQDQCRRLRHAPLQEPVVEGLIAKRLCIHGSVGSHPAPVFPEEPEGWLRCCSRETGAGSDPAAVSSQRYPQIIGPGPCAQQALRPSAPKPFAKAGNSGSQVAAPVNRFADRLRYPHRDAGQKRDRTRDRTLLNAWRRKN